MTWLEVRWALQVIAEEGFGRARAIEQLDEDMAMVAARRALESR